MTKKAVLLVIIAILIVGGVFIYRNFISTGLLREAVNVISPPTKDIKKFFAQGSELSFPLTLPKGLRIGIFADLESGKPRVLTFDPKGVLFASITNEGKVVALPDENGDGIADRTETVLSNLNKPHGILFNNGFLYVAESNQVVRYQYHSEKLAVGVREKLFDLPNLGNHFTRTIKVFEDKLYTSVGSSCNVCIESDSRRSTVLVSDLGGEDLRTFAKGLRNTVFFTFDERGNLWGSDMGRDLLGDNLPPDELNVVSSSKGSGPPDYGWPYCYGERVRDQNFESGNNLNYCANTEPTTFSYPAHVAPLGITFIKSELFTPLEQGDLLVSFHGSWNSSVPVGYKIVKLVRDGQKVTKMEDFITGFINEGEVLGRPVDLVFDEEGYLYISDDKAGLIYIVSKDN